MTPFRPPHSEVSVPSSCRRGHALEESNIYFRDGHPNCRACRRIATSQYRSRLLIDNRERIAEVNARTFCSNCGGQPVEWHNPDHVSLNQRLRRISNMIWRNPWSEIQVELSRCTPLCRRCHMREDGRMQTFVAHGSTSRTPQSPKPCAECHRLSKPRRRGLCGACYARQWKAGRKGPSL